MKKSLAFILCALAILSLSACANDDTQVTSKSPTPITQHSDGTLVIGDEISIPDTSVPQRDLHEQEVSIADGDISFDEACKKLQNCLSTDLFLPDLPSAYKVFYAGTATINDKKCYRLDLYTEINNTMMFVGTPYAVSCDGKFVFAKGIFGTYDLIQPINDGEQKGYKDIYSDKITVSPNDALKNIEKLSLKQIGIETELVDYYLQFYKELLSVTDDLCYKISLVDIPTAVFGYRQLSLYQYQQERFTRLTRMTVQSISRLQMIKIHLHKALSFGS